MPSATRTVLDVTRDLLAGNDDLHCGRLKVDCQCEICGARRKVALPGGRFYLDHTHPGNGGVGTWSVARMCAVPHEVEQVAAALAGTPRRRDDAILAAGLAQAATR